MPNLKLHILCVDDHQDLCELVAICLPDYTITSVHTKAEALHQAASKHFDLILLDYHLPDGTGFEVCRSIRAYDAQTPIYFFTGTKSLFQSQVDKIGAQGVIPKGANLIENLISTVSTVFPGQVSQADINL